MQEFSFKESSLKGAYIITPFFSEDTRGGLLKDYNESIFKENGINYALKETFYTISKKGVIRAIHFQLIKQQPKLVRCIKGHIYDVIVDLRPDSPTFTKWEGYDLTEENQLEILIPEYFGHGYLVIEDSIVSYKCAQEFFGDGDGGIMFNEPAIGIDWPFHKIGGIENMIISDKDKSLMTMNDYLMNMKRQK
ncbi:dTDP-4-dehydrorhamnose 3,5-epimerase [Treponema socranskii]|uniref:dTDP-4-dehydrorhamnose 3,5-epimerase n=1 Tax=Treponema socranskii TaxID=53419 RepID=UPI003D6FBF0D